jgi:quaternary ammonium compound-resistance protein SugE
MRQDDAERIAMSWLVLLLSGALEAVWATALGRSAGLTRALPTVVFGVSLLLSMSGLAFAMRSLPTGTAYAVWVGVGASLTVLVAMFTGQESASILRLTCVGAVVAGVVGLKLVH